MMCPYLLISINELLISIIPFIDINKYGLNVKTAAHIKVCKYFNKKRSLVPPIYNYQPGPEFLYQQNARRAKLPDHREHPVFPFKTFAADLLISINELLISINMVSASIFIDINKDGRRYHIYR